MVDKYDVSDGDGKYLVGREREDAVNKAGERPALTQEQFSYMSTLDEHGLKAYLESGGRGEDYQQRLVTVLKGSFDMATDKSQTESAQKLFYNTQSLMNQSKLSDTALSGWGEVLYYMEEKISNLPEGKGRTEVARNLFDISNSQYSNLYGGYKEEKEVLADAARRQQNIAKISKVAKPIPGLGGEVMSEVRKLGDLMHNAGASTNEVVPQKKRGLSRGGQSR